MARRKLRKFRKKLRFKRMKKSFKARVKRKKRFYKAVRKVMNSELETKYVDYEIAGTLTNFNNVAYSQFVLNANPNSI